MESVITTSSNVGIKYLWTESLFTGAIRKDMKIIRKVLCYDAGQNLYSIDPSAIPPNMLYSMELRARALVEVWPFIHDSLLEIGCGNKPYSLLINSLASKYVGVDLPNWIQQDQSDICADGLKLPFKYESFDTLLTMDVLTKIPSPTHLFREANRVLKHNGHLIIMVSNQRRFTNRPVFANYTAVGLRMLAEQHGFNVQVLSSNGKGIPFLFDSLIQALYYAINRNGRQAKTENKPTNGLTMVESLFVRLQKILLKITPRESINTEEDLSEMNGTKKDSRFKMGYIMVVKKVFSLDEVS